LAADTKKGARVSGFSRRTAMAAMLGALVAGGAAAQTGTKSLEAGKLFKYLNLYYRIPPAQRDQFQLSYFVRTKGAPVSALKMWSSQGTMPLAADGKIMRLPTAEMLKRKEQVSVQGPKGASIELDMELEPTVRPAAEMAAAPLVASVAEANKGIKGAAGLVGGLVPTMARLVFKNAGSGQVVLADGRRSPLPAAGADVFFDVNTPGARTLTFARVPSRIFMNPAPKPKKR
jgi:hypothetical protein